MRFRYGDVETWILNFQPCVHTFMCKNCRASFSIRTQKVGGDLSMTRLEHSAYLLDAFEGCCSSEKSPVLIIAHLPATCRLFAIFKVQVACVFPFHPAAIRYCDNIGAWNSYTEQIRPKLQCRASLFVSPSFRFTALHRYSLSTNNEHTQSSTRLSPASLQNYSQDLPTASRQLYKRVNVLVGH